MKPVKLRSLAIYRTVYGWLIYKGNPNGLDRVKYTVKK